MTADTDNDTEIYGLLDDLYGRFHYDFRQYAKASLRRRLASAQARFNVRTTRDLRARLRAEPALLTSLLDFLTVQVSEMFRDPNYFFGLRSDVLPVLATYPQVRIWVPGCSAGEEAYSIAVLLKEEGLLERSFIYATDINPAALARARAGIFDTARMAQFTANHRLSGARSSLSDHYHAAPGGALMDSSLRERIMFSDHSLATDSVFSEVQLISCRNVLIYFDKPLQNRALDLFNQSLCRRGWLGLGIKETLRFTSQADHFDEIRRDVKLYRRRQ
ncbi:MAG: protein-glutamate O-methyltransferase CheR [Steroidobacteraceae bacterium]